MGIRYYAYAFEAEDTERAIQDPRAMMARDPLSDAWGIVSGRRGDVATLKQHTPERNMLYLDKAWGALQSLTSPSVPGRPRREAFHIFEGDVTLLGDGAMHGASWDPWVRAVTPEKTATVADDLLRITAAQAMVQLLRWFEGRQKPEIEAQYVVGHLKRAQQFMTGLREEQRGMVYMIG